MKGNIIDLIPLIVIIFAFFIGLVFALVLYNGFNDIGAFSSISGLNDSVTQTISVLDYSSPLLLIGLGLASVIGAFFIRTHPIFFFVSVILLSIVMLISTIMNNVMETFTTNPSIIGYANQLPITSLTMQNMVIVIFGIGIAILIALYAKPGGE